MAHYMRLKRGWNESKSLFMFKLSLKNNNVNDNDSLKSYNISN